ncbi:MAG: HAMP domain-containing histidine kinase, partial [Eubacterium sp.]|nr:HAMP domain-containing histidine kinase [Eubacterium sp.]
MELRKRIAFGFILTILLSVVSFVILYSFMVRFMVNSIGQQYGFSNPSYENLYNNTLLVSSRMDDMIEMLQEEVSENPEILEDREYLEKTGKKLEEGVISLILTNGNVIRYASNDMIGYRRLQELLSQDKMPPDGVVISGQLTDGTLYRRIRIQYADGKEGNLFLISTLSRIAPEIKNWLAMTIILVISILGVICTLTARWIYRGVEKPIRELRGATKNIRDGNLDFSVRPSGIEELDELCQDFEEMRIRLKESSEKALETERQNRELVSNISHDLKTPVTTVKGYAEGILDGIADTPEKMERYIRTIHSKASDMDRLIDELRVYSHIDANQTPYTFVRLLANEYFSDCAEELSIEMQERGIAFSYENSLKESILIVADPEQLKRVINNIVGNAIKYRREEDPYIRLRIRDVGDFIQVEIEDNGKGISKEDLPRIFDRFYR